MNLILTCTSIEESVQDLDNNRLKNQYKLLTDVINTVVLQNPTYTDIVLESAFFSVYKRRLNEVFYKTTVDNPVVTWAKQTPIHFTFAVMYYLAVHKTMRERELLSISNSVAAFRDATTKLHKYIIRLVGILPVQEIGWFNQNGLDFATYLSTSRGELLAAWKRDILKAHAYDLAMSARREGKSLHKPRKSKPLSWIHVDLVSSKQLIYAPKWAYEELNKYKESPNAA